MLDRNQALAVSVDLQEKLVPAMAHPDTLIPACGFLLEGLHILKVPMLATQQYTKGLGSTLPELMPMLDGKWIEKITFSCWKEPTFRETVERSEAKQIIVLGTETHICVEQTVLELLEAGYQVFLAADCVGSRFDLDRDMALRRMEQAGAVITTAEAMLYELMATAKAEEFRQISALVKARKG